ncbi:hypothetical protein ACFY4C_41355 [Actinomadura viridis]|uniref:hypothetical protein n=1 Tax=Actinomadura viridis TaxID=58110 RepID=UPI0036BB90C9
MMESARNLEFAEGVEIPAARPPVGQAVEVRQEKPNRDGAALEVLTTMLQTAVPLNIFQMQSWTADQRCETGRAQASTIGSHGDDLLYGGKHCAESFNALAKGLAALAYQPGGVTFLGLHWCVEEHLDCPRRPYGTAAQTDDAKEASAGEGAAEKP